MVSDVVETVATVGSGFMVSWCIAYWILPLWGYDVPLGTATEITLVYTVAALIRVYAVRRFFRKMVRNE